VSQIVKKHTEPQYEPRHTDEPINDDTSEISQMRAPSDEIQITSPAPEEAGMRLGLMYGGRVG